MPDLTITQMLLIAGSAVAGGLLALAAAQLVVGGRLKALQARLDKVEKARAQTNDMLMQARRQAEALQKEVLALRKPVAQVQPAAVPLQQLPQVQAHHQPHPQPQAAARPQHSAMNQASLEQSQALARARERTKQLLEDELDRTMVLHRPPGGFADTQPLSQM